VIFQGYILQVASIVRRFDETSDQSLIHLPVLFAQVALVRFHPILGHES